ncbi:MAG: allantoate amidohydrolase [Actinomycetia bacterium]|nr:allantoate amidohydrolase [Actinomycetes bacterium]
MAARTWSGGLTIRIGGTDRNRNPVKPPAPQRYTANHGCYGRENRATAAFRSDGLTDSLAGVMSSQPRDAPRVGGGPVRIDVERVLADIAELAAYREPDEPGSTRRVFRDAHRSGRVWLAARMAEVGLEVETDGAGNLIGTRTGRGAPGAVVTGSHTDTVRGGGRYDGVLGVLGGLEAARALSAAGIELEHDLQVVDFLGEEPNDWGLSCVGSRAVTGGLARADLERTDAHGRTLARALADFGRDPETALTGRWPLPHAFVELHIEQGPVLELAGRAIGVVTGIVGVHRVLVEFAGRRDHAGTMPMDQRHDAACAAAELMLAVEALAQGGGGVGTTGRVEVEPGAMNVVPDRARVWMELRSIDPAWVSERRDAALAAAAAAASRRGVGLSVDVLSDEPPTPMDPQVRGAIDAAARAAGYDPLELASGAEHDTRQIARIARSGLIFVPSLDGRSHCAEEWTDPADLAAGIGVLAATIVGLDRLPPPSPGAVR